MQKTLVVCYGNGQNVHVLTAVPGGLHTTDKEALGRLMALRMPFCSAATGIVRRLAGRARVVRIAPVRVRVRLSGGAVRAEVSARRKAQRAKEVGIAF